MEASEREHSDVILTAKLDAELLSAHLASDYQQLVELYYKAGRMKEQEDIDAACFYFTHAYVFALESGDDLAGEILDKLVVHGREDYPKTN